eukprot:10965.XXX_314409_314528_1 [CDS] Oithona nana genome sequencing.
MLRFVSIRRWYSGFESFSSFIILLLRSLRRVPTGMPLGL